MTCRACNNLASRDGPGPVRPPARAPDTTHRGRIYRGVRDQDGAGHVWVVPYKADAYPLPARLELRGHSPTGFEWGYGGSGPAQLALALLAHAVGDRPALEWYQDFKFDVIAGLAQEQWELTDDSIEAWVEQRMRTGERTHGG